MQHAEHDSSPQIYQATEASTWAARWGDVVVRMDVVVDVPRELREAIRAHSALSGLHGGGLHAFLVSLHAPQLILLEGLLGLGM